MIRVVIADDQAMIRSGLRSLLDGEPDLRVVGEAADGSEAVRVVLREQPDVALVDIRMPVLDGIAATRRIVAAGARTRVLTLTTFGLEEHVFDALRAGAAGFVVKDAPFEELAAGVRAVAAGDAVLSPAVTRAVIEAVASSPRPSASASAAIASLTARELEVLRLIAAGLTNHEIAGRLVVSDATAKTHVSNVLGKVGARDRVQAVILAYEAGVVAVGAVAPEAGVRPGSRPRA